MELAQLKNFIEVADRGSFTHAADALGLNQPALSRQIRRLEIELRKNLLYRHGRGVRLTDAGEHFATTARNVLHQLEQATQMVPDNDTGRIVIGLPPSLGHLLTVRLMRAFSARFSQARISIVEGLSPKLQERLLTDEIDLALLHLPVATASIEWETITHQPICLISPKHRDDTPADEVSLAAVAELPLIFPNSLNPVHAIVHREAAQAGLQLDVAQEIDGMDTILELVQNGFGYAVATAAAVQNTPYAKTLQVRRIIDPALIVTLTMASRARRAQTPLHNKSAALLKDVIANALGLN